jgi:hypothetical protein
VVEGLGTKHIDGVDTEGVRRTTTIPTGEVGNDAPLVTTSESWIDRSLNLTVRSSEEDPIRGKTAKDLVSLKLGEPDPALFKPPSDYKMIIQHMQKVPCQDIEPTSR